MSHVNSYQRVTLTKENFNNQVDRMTLSVNTSQPFPPVTVSSPNGLMNKDSIGGRNGGYVWAPRHGVPFTKANLAMATAECPMWQQQKLTMSSWYDTIPPW